MNVILLSENWAGIKEQSYSLKKRMSSKWTYFIRGCAFFFSRSMHMSGKLTISVEMIGRSPIAIGEECIPLDHDAGVSTTAL